MLFDLSDTELRSKCREKIESLEFWLRRLVDEVLAANYGDYFNAVDGQGNKIIKSSLSEKVKQRRAK